MEWVLQIADEVDDALGALRHGWLGLAAEIGALMLASVGIAADVAGHALGAQPALLGAAAICANIAALLKIRNSRQAQRA